MGEVSWLTQKKNVEDDKTLHIFVVVKPCA